MILKFRLIAIPIMSQDPVDYIFCIKMSYKGVRLLLMTNFIFIVEC